jgi:hypothetical protein
MLCLIEVSRSDMEKLALVGVANARRDSIQNDNTDVNSEWVLELA